MKWNRGIRWVLMLAVTGVVAACGGGDDAAEEQRRVPTAYPDVADMSHATLKVANTMTGFFEAKSRHEPAAMVSFFAAAPQPIAYIDAGLGFAWTSQQALLDVWSSDQFAHAPPQALSYPVRVIGDERSAIVEFVDTPELLGSEFRFLASVTFDAAGKIIRWVDYWDGRSSQFHLPIGTWGPYPEDFRDAVVNASDRIRSVAGAWQTALAEGDATAAASLLTEDALFEDLALHARLSGRLQIQRFLERGADLLPYGSGSAPLHISGSDMGGGVEWRAASSAAPLVRGISAIELDDGGRITRISVMYDAYQLTDDAYRTLVLLAAEPTP